MEGPASAREGASAAQQIAAVIFGGLVGAIGAATLSPVQSIALLLSPIYMLNMLFLLGAAFEPPVAPASTTAETTAAALPNYTVLVALYDEAAVAASLVDALAALDYPADRLQVLFLTEMDDEATRAALRRARPPPHFEIVVVPPGGPRTKPNALNYGLSLARGRCVTVFDAEDAPDPAQLRRAALAFSVAPSAVVCLQARLVIDNPADSWFSLMMAIEYAALFDATKCGFAAMAMPVALGGSSNHFRTEALVRLGGWDAWNVTEDADLGLRIALAGSMVQDLPSVTLEEAPVGFSAWLGQRRRWQKGFLQTIIAHSRAPRAGIRAMGLTNWLAGMAQVCGAVLGSLFFPIFTVQLVWMFSTGAITDNATPLATVLNIATQWVAVCGVMSMILPTAIGLRRRGTWHLSPWIFALPIYQMFVSVAAWMAVIDYVRDPFRWLKTEHGRGSTRGGAAFRSTPGSR